MNAGSVVYTNKAHCRDCCRCVRVCPVKAIRMKDGQAFVVAEECLSCGTCIRECPQGAKTYRRDVDRVMAMVAGPGLTAVSVAPSFAALFADWERRRLPSALRRLGFGHVAETAVGAYHVATATADWVAARPGASHIATACPAVVRYLELHHPAAAGCLVPLASPMVAHARHLKATLGPATRVVFIGPCVAKKMEADRPAAGGAVDAVLTFEELKAWLQSAGVELDACEESDFDEQPLGQARMFPLAGGCLRTGAMDDDPLSPKVLAVSGFEEVREAAEGVAEDGARVIEPLFCRQGCINGPAFGAGCNVFQRRDALLAYAGRETPERGGAARPDAWPELDTCFEVGRREATGLPADADILKELERTGKARPEDQLNCGACGYGSCREKAVAVLRGMAEPEMCLPFMRRRAEQRTDRIIETSPNGIVILDARLNIIGMNPAFRRFFMCTEAVLGRHVSYLMDPGGFEKLASGASDLLESVNRQEKYGLICHEILYALRDEQQFVGIFVNITHSRSSQDQLRKLRRETLIQAQELLDHQVAMAQKVTQFLGESAAQGEVLVEHLRQLALDEEPGDGGREEHPWRRDISMSRR